MQLNRFFMNPNNSWRAILALWFLVIGISSNGQTYNDSASHYSLNFTSDPMRTNFGSGVSLADFNQDGLDDITLATGLGDSLVFFQNTGSGFSKVFPSIGHMDEAESVMWLDFDNDGDKDFYVSTYLGRNELYRNDGFPNFIEITDSVGLMDTLSQTFGVCWGDYNRDGYLDLYETNRQTNNVTNLLYYNNGNDSLINNTITAGVADAGNMGFAGSFIDFNNDDWPDIFVANDRNHGNQLFKNLMNGTFSNVSASSSMNATMNGMTATIGDYNNDGYLDVYVSNTVEGNALFRNNGDETFTDVTNTMGVAVNGICWGATFFDYDLDGDQDLYVSDMIAGDTSRNTLFENVDTAFISHSPAFAGDTLMSLSHAIADFNGDGHYDIVSPNQHPFALQFWQSSNANSNHWVKISLEGVVSNRDAIGTWIEVHADGGTQYRYTHCGGSYLAQNGSHEIFGLAQDTLIDTLVLRWNSGHRDTLFDLGVNQVYHFVEGLSVQTNAEVVGSNWYCQGDSIQSILKVSNDYNFSKFIWSTGDTTANIVVNGPGTYWVWAENSFGFSDTSALMEIFVDSLSLSASSISDTSSLGQGSATVNVIGGIPPFQYSWNDPMSQTNSTASNLQQGSYWCVVTDSLGCIDSIMVTVDNYSGIGLISRLIQRGVKLYPNPSETKVHIELLDTDRGNLNFNIYSPDGKLIKSWDGSSSESYLIDVENWNGGLYILRIASASGEGPVEFVKFQVK